MKLDYRMSTLEGSVNEGSVSFEDEVHLIFPVNNETIEEIKAVTEISVADDEKIFVNGYQTWTHCRELTKKNRTVKTGKGGAGVSSQCRRFLFVTVVSPIFYLAT